MEELYVRFGANVRQQRRAQKLSQERLGELTDMGRPTVAAIEAGRQAVTLHQAVALSNVLAVGLMELIGVGGAPSVDGLEQVLDDHDLRIVQQLRGAS
ncbi:helix-turn-helix domain-containing protein [Acidovorax cavernicola]|uniref:helix-turn-helix domain-containing protein n=1 Tax=Acidovorax cavernicola TaxID=1675792 RepID=UPI00142E1303|nr:helix-turn-helix transcriptional regulator [Acidovorax cavernicola]